MPKVVCNDGYLRRFFPSQGVGSHLKMSVAHVSRAYCEECGIEFRAVESAKQMDDWKAHTCDTSRLKKYVPKDKK